MKSTTKEMQVTKELFPLARVANLERVPRSPRFEKMKAEPKLPRFKRMKAVPRTIRSTPSNR